MYIYINIYKFNILFYLGYLNVFDIHRWDRSALTAFMARPLHRRRLVNSERLRSAGFIKCSLSFLADRLAVVAEEIPD